MRASSSRLGKSTGLLLCTWMASSSFSISTVAGQQPKMRRDGFWRVLVSWTTARREGEVCRYSWVDEIIEVRSRFSMLLAKCRNDDVSFLREVCVCCGISLCIHVILDGENSCRHSDSMRKRSKESRTVCCRCPNGPHEGGTPPKNPRIAPESQSLFLCCYETQFFAFLKEHPKTVNNFKLIFSNLTHTPPQTSNHTETHTRITHTHTHVPTHPRARKSQHATTHNTSTRTRCDSLTWR